jgi:hypothetical protein
MKDIRTIDKKRLELSEIQHHFSVDNYLELVKIVTNLIDEGILISIKSSKLNGKKPALYNRYNIIKKEEDTSKYIDELVYKLNIHLDKTYYMRNIDKYKKDRKIILSLSKFLDEKIELLNTKVAVNERSFQMWGIE